MDKKSIAILGSTGSIGTQTLDLIELNKDIRVAALTGSKNVPLMAEQVSKFSPELVCMYDESSAKELEKLVDTRKTRVVSGPEGLCDAASYGNADMVLSAVVGMVGIEPAMCALDAGKSLALANKETLVAAGHLIMPLAKRKGIQILPVDSEHSAIFQCIQGSGGNRVKRIILTASGGPFRGFSREQLENVTLEMALKHPNWAMGRKVTIDSATMVNKGLEVIEARWLFDMDPSNIEVHVHPQSILHSAVEFEDNGVIAQLGVPDMHIPISYALYYPERRPALTDQLDLFSAEKLTFYKPDQNVFTGLKLAYRAIEEGGNMPAVFNTANEYAVDLFLRERIGFTEIPDVIEECMDRIPHVEEPGLEEIGEIKDQTEEIVRSLWPL
ncbi:MAG: 1-deoxy-D-xylulose-5-phosphate reductoisomerase [Lachnospiraceae bacterium]|nr:1-deoxy-D-xylulose-5-phosphate reductoisomerase [Lachnospiraceae bacterium]